MYLTPNLHFQHLSRIFSVPVSLSKDCLHPCSVPSVLLISPFLATKGWYSPFSPVCLCKSVTLQSSTGLHKFSTIDLKSNIFMSQPLSSTEHCLTCPNLSPNQKPSNNKIYPSNHSWQNSWLPGSFSWYTLCGGR